jgi:hypothetical protein
MKKRPAKKFKRTLFAHHRHTGKVLHRRHTSYALLAFLLLAIGMLLCTASIAAYADPPPPIPHDYTVHASVKGIPPAQAVILSPIDGSTVDAVPIIVSGTCEPGAMIKLYRNNLFSGAVMCAGDGTFEIQTDLFVGPNELIARSFNATDDEGAPSDPVIVTYTPPPTPPSAPPTEPSPPSAPTTQPAPIVSRRATPETGNPLVIKAENDYRGFNVGEIVEWELEISGGRAPYAVVVDWGDGKRDVISRATAGRFTAEHVYAQAGGFRGSYAVKVTASDARGVTSMIQLMVIVNSKDVSALGSSAPSLSDRIQPTLFSWSAYAILLLMLLCFWLGERRELDILRLPGRRLAFVPVGRRPRKTTRKQSRPR